MSVAPCLVKPIEASRTQSWGMPFILGAFYALFLGILFASRTAIHQSNALAKKMKDIQYLWLSEPFNKPVQSFYLARWNSLDGLPFCLPLDTHTAIAKASKLVIGFDWPLEAGRQEWVDCFGWILLWLVSPQLPTPALMTRATLNDPSVFKYDCGEAHTQSTCRS